MVKSKISIREITIDAIFVALTFIFTMVLQFRLPFMGNGGLIHLGNVPMLIRAFAFGKKTGAIAGGLGMALFDLVSGWAIWAPFTFVIVATAGWVAGSIGNNTKIKESARYPLAVAVVCVLKAFGYYLAEVFLYGNFITPLGSMPGDFIQVIVAGIIVLPIIGKLKKVFNK